MVNLEGEVYKEFSWIKGDLGQMIVQIKFFSNLPKETVVIDGHKPHYFSNLSAGEYQPQHLDIVGVNKETNEVKFVCEVKTTITTKNKFDANGLCMVFMKKAKENGIPVYFSVVRLNRELDERVIKSYNSESGETKVDEAIFKAELEYFLENGKVEFYKENEFEMSDNKFIIE